MTWFDPYAFNPKTGLQTVSHAIPAIPATPQAPNSRNSTNSSPEPSDANLWCEAEERAALREFTGGQSRAAAEASTLAELIGIHGRAPEGWPAPHTHRGRA